MDALVCARVLSAELLDVDQACAAFPREAEDCNLTDLVRNIDYYQSRLK